MQMIFMRSLKAGCRCNAAGLVWLGREGTVGFVSVWQAWFGTAGWFWLVPARMGWARHGPVWHGRHVAVGLGFVRSGRAWQARRVMAGRI